MYSSTLTLTLALDVVGGQGNVPNLYPRERAGIHFIGGWVVPRFGLDGCGKTSLHGESIPGPSSLLRVAIPTESIINFVTTLGFPISIHLFMQGVQHVSSSGCFEWFWVKKCCVSICPVLHCYVDTNISMCAHGCNWKFFKKASYLLGDIT
jgi:hypothetical protein